MYLLAASPAYVCACTARADLFHLQSSYKRAWHLLILGLEQEESMARFMAMSAILLVIPYINETLLDIPLREVINPSNPNRHFDTG